MAWCPECEKYYNEKSGVCPVCGELLEDKAVCESAACSGDCASCAAAQYEEEACSGNCDPGIWPSDDNGDPVKPALLMTVTGTQIDYEMALAQLRSYGIPSAKDYPLAGQIAKVILGFAGTGMDIYVPETMLEIARELMKPIDESEA